MYRYLKVENSRKYHRIKRRVATTVSDYAKNSLNVIELSTTYRQVVQFASFEKLSSFRLTINI